MLLDTNIHTFGIVYWVPSLKLTTVVSNRNLLFQGSIFRGYVVSGTVNDGRCSYPPPGNKPIPFQEILADCFLFPRRGFLLVPFKGSQKRVVFAYCLYTLHPNQVLFHFCHVWLKLELLS